MDKLLIALVAVVLWALPASAVAYQNRRDTFNSQSGEAPGTGLCDGSSAWDGGSNSLGHPDTATGYRCIDQPGSGTSIDIGDVFPYPPTLQANNLLDPIYVWGNTINTLANNCGNLGCISQGHVLVDRDIIFGTARPGYSAFQYPHPLTLGTSPPPPGRPTGLTVTWEGE